MILNELMELLKLSESKNSKTSLLSRTYLLMCVMENKLKGTGFDGFISLGETESSAAFKEKVILEDFLLVFNWIHFSLLIGKKRLG